MVIRLRNLPHKQRTGASLLCFLKPSGEIFFTLPFHTFAHAPLQTLKSIVCQRLAISTSLAGAVELIPGTGSERSFTIWINPAALVLVNSKEQNLCDGCQGRFGYPDEAGYRDDPENICKFCEPSNMCTRCSHPWRSGRFHCKQVEGDVVKNGDHICALCVTAGMLDMDENVSIYGTDGVAAVFTPHFRLVALCYLAAELLAVAAEP